MTGDAGARAMEAIGDDPDNAYVTVLDEPIGGGEGPLEDLTLVVKDNLAVRAVPLTCGSAILADHVAPFTATVVERALAKGAVVVAKANMDEFAAGSRGEHSAFGATENPAAPGRVPGGSSSGCGASLAAGHVDLALGSDTGGSTRAPAAYTGVVALKPTTGRLSRWGLVDLAMSLDQVGPMARTVTGVAALYDAVAGLDPRDPTTRSDPPERTQPRVEQPDLDGVRLGVPASLPDGVDDETEARFWESVDRLESQAGEVVSVELPDSQRALATYYVTCYAEFASAMHKFDGSLFGGKGQASRQGLGAECKRRILLGTFITAREQRSAWYERARRARASLAAQWAALFEQVDLALTPTMPGPPPRRGQELTPLEEYAADVLTVHANLARLPAGSVPMGTVDGGPVGLQLLGPAGADALVLEAMAAFEGVGPSRPERPAGARREVGS